MRATLLCLVALLVVPYVDAAPAPAPGLKAKEKLRALKKRLPAVLERWVKERKVGHPFTYTPVLRRVRAIGVAEAKVVVHLHLRDDHGKVSDSAEYMLTVYLTYYDGLWTAVRFQWSYPDIHKINDNWTDAAHFLMDAIDEAAEK